MQIKKVDWINRPEKMRANSYSISFDEKGKRAALYTLGKEEEIALSYEGDGVSFFLFHTENDYLIISSTLLSFNLFSLKGKYELPFEIKSLLIRKENERIVFISDGKEIMSLENEAFTESASVGFLIRNEEEKPVRLFFK
ncbi:MAG TPA: hypothetical protein IAB12_06500 [Candidatus Ornithospirochaeta avicola]|uniref:Uncharacterized protein n=1 Tax=Candidatus Ornithospirochaeta avicola TaxID=2840896 RepID=A0A9D1PU78_9SPIO|nr:hypothetical protein [Candidatus Ornithospirochaeta avicola]